MLNKNIYIFQLMPTQGTLGGTGTCVCNDGNKLGKIGH